MIKASLVFVLTISSSFEIITFMSTFPKPNTFVFNSKNLWDDISVSSVLFRRVMVPLLVMFILFNTPPVIFTSQFIPDASLTPIFVISALIPDSDLFCGNPILMLPYGGLGGSGLVLKLHSVLSDVSSSGSVA